MYLSTALALASSAGLASAHPFRGLTSRSDVAAFPAGQSWDILLASGGSIGNVKSAVDDSFQVLDIDLFDTDKQTISDLKSSKQVICYFSAGSKEGWRPDAGDFKDGDTGKELDGWPDEVWVNVKSENVKNIMKKRIQKAKDAGCSAIDPDNVDGFDGGQDGFGYQKDDYVKYIKFLAQEAQNAGLAIGLKNAVDMIPDVVDVMQFAVNEQCHEYEGECEKYKPFTDQNKAVFNIEYGGNACNSPAGVKLSTVIKSEDQALNQLGGACAGQGAGTPTTGGKQSPQPSATKGNQPSQPSVPASSALPGAPAPTQGGAQPRPTGSYSQEPEEKEGENETPDDDEEDDNDDENDVPAEKEEEGQVPDEEEQEQAPGEQEEENDGEDEEEDENENEDENDNENEYENENEDEDGAGSEDDEEDEEDDDEPAPPTQTGRPGRPGRPGQQYGWGYGSRYHGPGGRYHHN